MLTWVPDYVWTFMALVCLGLGLLLALLHDLLPWIRSRGVRKSSRSSWWQEWLNLHGFWVSCALLFGSVVFAGMWLMAWFSEFRT